MALTVLRLWVLVSFSFLAANDPRANSIYPPRRYRTLIQYWPSPNRRAMRVDVRFLVLLVIVAKVQFQIEFGAGFVQFAVKFFQRFRRIEMVGVHRWQCFR